MRETGRPEGGGNPWAEPTLRQQSLDVTSTRYRALSRSVPTSTMTLTVDSC